MDFLDILAHVLPEVAVGCCAFDGYVAFMDGMEDYFRASLDLLDSSVRRELFQSDPAHPHQGARHAARALRPRLRGEKLRYDRRQHR